MSIWGVLGVLFLIIQFVYERYAKQNADKESEDIKETTLDSDSEIKENVLLEQTPIVTKQGRKIQDREAEIIGVNNTFTKEQFVKDYIMAEILSKPKSKK
ncbi:MAG: hypothetical protein Q3988_05430 [Gemella sp.]|nr:hypothetical protein [Gemella sp.]